MSVIQVLQVFDHFSIDWGHPFDKVLVALRMIVIDLDLLRFECVAGTQPVARYVTESARACSYYSG